MVLKNLDGHLSKGSQRSGVLVGQGCQRGRSTSELCINSFLPGSYLLIAWRLFGSIAR